MANRKPMLTHTRYAREVAKSGAPLEAQRAHMSARHQAIVGAATGTPVSGSGAHGGRIANARAASQTAQHQAEQTRIANARAGQQAQLHRDQRIHNARMGLRGKGNPIVSSPVSQSKNAISARDTKRSIGRERVEPTRNSFGVLQPAYAARIDAHKVGLTAGYHRTRVTFPRPGG
jgi:hypothetical protein